MWRAVSSQYQARAGSAEESTTAAKKKASKTKFTCPSCGQNAWAKVDAALMLVPYQEIVDAVGLDEADGTDD